MIHITLHFLIPALVATGFFRRDWKRAYLVMAATMLVDVDHLMAEPIYDAGRCSIGFHPLHRLAFIGIYAALSLIPKTRLVGIGLVLHMALDAIDCQLTNQAWSN